MQSTSLIQEAKKSLEGLLAALETALDADVLTLVGAIRGGIDLKVRTAWNR